MSTPSTDREFVPTVPEGLPAGERPMIAVVRALDGHENQLAATIATLAAAVRSERGCIQFRSFRDATNPGVFYLYEIYADIDAFRTHLTTPHVARFHADAAQHSTADARSLVQLVELPADGG